MIRRIKKVFWEAKYDEEFNETLFDLCWKITSTIISIISAIFIWIFAVSVHALFDTLTEIFNFEPWKHWKIGSVIFVLVFYLIIRFTIYFLRDTIELNHEKMEEYWIRKLGKYGRVVSKRDWTEIKENTSKAEYTSLFRKSWLKCYYYEAWLMASFIEDAQLMCCSIIVNGKRVAKTVILKNKCVYDLTNHVHFDYDTYIEAFDVEIFKIFPEKEFYVKNEDEFKAWCEKHNVECKF